MRRCLAQKAWPIMLNAVNITPILIHPDAGSRSCPGAAFLPGIILQCSRSIDSSSRIPRSPELTHKTNNKLTQANSSADRSRLHVLTYFSHPPSPSAQSGYYLANDCSYWPAPSETLGFPRESPGLSTGKDGRKTNVLMLPISQRPILIESPREVSPQWTLQEHKAEEPDFKTPKGIVNTETPQKERECFSLLG